MFRLLSIAFVLTIFQYGSGNPSGSADVYAACRLEHSAPFSNDFLLGKWYQVLRFQLFGMGLPNAYCGSQLYSKATAEDLKPYEAHHNVTLSMEDNPLLIDNDNGYRKNLLIGNIGAKDFYLDYEFPTPSMTVWNFMNLTEGFALQWDCALRGFDVWLLSRTPQPSDAEMNAAVAGVSFIAHRDRTKYCVY